MTTEHAQPNARWQMRRIETSPAQQDARQTPPPVSLSPGQRIAQAAQFFTRLRGIPEQQRDVYRQYGIYTNEAWCVNFVSAVCASAGLRPPGGAHVNNIPEIGRRVQGRDVQVGDIAVNSRHTGVVLNVNRDGNGNPVSYDLLNGNTVENGKWTVGITKVALGNNPYQLYRHNGDASRVAPPAIFSASYNIQGSIFSSDTNQRRAMSPHIYRSPFETVAMNHMQQVQQAQQSIFKMHRIQTDTPSMRG